MHNLIFTSCKKSKSQKLHINMISYSYNIYTCKRYIHYVFSTCKHLLEQYGAMSRTKGKEIAAVYFESPSLTENLLICNTNISGNIAILSCLLTLDKPILVVISSGYPT